MPLYEYKCRKCDAVFEVLQKFSDATLKVHAGCGGAVDRQMTAPTFQFKGSGWYITDYAAKNAPKEESKGETTADNTADKKTDEKAEAKSETKAATKTENGSEAKSETADKPKKKEGKKTKV